MGAISFGEYQQRADFAPYVAQYRLGFGDDAPLVFSLDQPAGNYSDPPLDDFVVTVGLSSHRSIYRNGNFSFSGLNTPGQWSLFAMGQANQITIDDPNRFRGLVIPRKRFDRLSLELSADGWDMDQDALHQLQTGGSVPLLVERIWSLCENGTDTISPIYMESLTLVVLGEVFAPSSRPSSFAKGRLHPVLLKRCTDYLAQQFNRDVSLGELANLTGLSMFHFSRAFTATVGMAPHRYILTLRVQEATRLLRTTNLTIGQIAEAVGYKTPQALSRMFKTMIGRTPSDVRQG